MIVHGKCKVHRLISFFFSYIYERLYNILYDNIPYIKESSIYLSMKISHNILSNINNVCKISVNIYPFKHKNLTTAPYKHFTATSFLISIFNRHLSLSLLYLLWHKGTEFLPPQDKSDASIYKIFLLHLVQCCKAECSRKNNLTVDFTFKRIQRPWYFEKK